MLNIPKGHELSWLAGFLDGEGSFGLYTQTSSYWRKTRKGTKYTLYPKISVGSTDKDLVEKAAEIMDTKVFKKAAQSKYSDAKPFWQFSIQGVKAIKWMRKLAPLLCARRRNKIIEILMQWIPWAWKRIGNFKDYEDRKYVAWLYGADEVPDIKLPDNFGKATRFGTGRKRLPNGPNGEMRFKVMNNA